MTQNEFEELLRFQPWDIVIWDKHYAYKPNSYTSESVHLQSVGNEYNYQVLDKNNYENFELKLSGEMQAVMILVQKQFKTNMQSLADMVQV
jgi:hypothetical protein